MPLFSWMHALPREHRRRIRQAASPQEACLELATALGLNQSIPTPTAPVGLIEDVHKKLAQAQRQAMDLEEELAKQDAAHESEIATLYEEHRKSVRRAKLQLLAQCAPHHPAAREALHCDQAPTLVPVTTAILCGHSGRRAASQSRSSMSSLTGRLLV